LLPAESSELVLRLQAVWRLAVWRELPLSELRARLKPTGRPERVSPVASLQAAYPWGRARSRLVAWRGAIAPVRRLRQPMLQPPGSRRRRQDEAGEGGAFRSLHGGGLAEVVKSMLARSFGLRPMPDRTPYMRRKMSRS